VAIGIFTFLACGFYCIQQSHIQAKADFANKEKYAVAPDTARTNADTEADNEKDKADFKEIEMRDDKLREGAQKK